MWITCNMFDLYYLNCFYHLQLKYCCWFIVINKHMDLEILSFKNRVCSLVFCSVLLLTDNVTLQVELRHVLMVLLDQNADEMVAPPTCGSFCSSSCKTPNIARAIYDGWTESREYLN